MRNSTRVMRAGCTVTGVRRVQACTGSVDAFAGVEFGMAAVSIAVVAIAAARLDDAAGERERKEEQRGQSDPHCGSPLQAVSLVRCRMRAAQNEMTYSATQ